MKIPADQVLRTWTGSPALGAASAKDSMLVSFAPLGYKGIRSASLRWWSFQNLRWSQVLTSVPNRISPPKTLFSIWQIIISSKWGFAPAWYSHSALCKLSFALVNDKLQEAEEGNEELQEAGAMTIISMMIDDCPLEMIYDSLFGSRAVSIGRSQIETARRRSRRAAMSRA